VLEIVVWLNTTLQNRLLKWWLLWLINTCSCYLLTDVRLINTPSFAHHYWALCIDINDGLLDIENLIADCPMDLG